MWAVKNPALFWNVIPQFNTDVIFRNYNGFEFIKLNEQLNNINSFDTEIRPSFSTNKSCFKYLLQLCFYIEVGTYDGWHE